MAIIRPARGGGQKRKTTEVTKVAAVIDTKKAQIEKKQAVKVNKKTDSVDKSKAKVNKKKSPPKKKAPAKPKLLSPPKEFKTEEDWLKYFRGESIAKVSDYLEKTPDTLSMEAGLALRRIGITFIKATSPLPTDHNDWLEFFSTMTGEETEEFIATHKLNNEAKAAGMRWLAIGENPALIDKIVNSRLENKKSEQLGDIVEAAQSRDEIKMFEAIRNKVAYQIQDGSGSRDMTVLIKQLREVAGILAELYRAAGMQDTEQSNIRKLLMNARQRSRRPKQQAVMKISDIEAGDEMESI